MRLLKSYHFRFATSKLLNDYYNIFALIIYLLLLAIPSYLIPNGRFFLKQTKNHKSIVESF